MTSDRSLLHRAVYHRYEPRPLAAKNEPDGDVFAPHHLYIGLAVLMLGYALVWPALPLVGAAGMLMGIVIVADGVLHHALGATLRSTSAGGGSTASTSAERGHE